MSNEAQSFRGTRTQMLLCCGIITRFAIEDAIQAKLQTYDGTYTPTWLTEHQDRIEQAMTNIIGFSPSSNLLSRTIELLALQDEAYKQVSLLQVLLKNKFAKDPEQLNRQLSDLGFTEFLKGAQDGNQSALLALVTRINQMVNQDADRYDLLVNQQKIGAVVFEQIKNYASALLELNQTQEMAKEEKAEHTSTGKAELLDIYNETIKICKLGYTLFHDEPVIRNRFSYNRTLSRMRGGRDAREADDSPNPDGLQC